FQTIPESRLEPSPPQRQNADLRLQRRAVPPRSRRKISRTSRGHRPSRMVLRKLRRGEGIRPRTQREIRGRPLANLRLGKTFPEGAALSPASLALAGRG